MIKVTLPLTTLIFPKIPPIFVSPPPTPTPAAPHLSVFLLLLLLNIIPISAPFSSLPLSPSTLPILSLAPPPSPPAKAFPTPPSISISTNRIPAPLPSPKLPKPFFYLTWSSPPTPRVIIISIYPPYTPPSIASFLRPIILTLSLLNPPPSLIPSLLFSISSGFNIVFLLFSLLSFFSPLPSSSGCSSNPNLPVAISPSPSITFFLNLKSSCFKTFRLSTFRLHYL